MEDKEEKHSEVGVQSEERDTKLISVYLSPEMFANFLDIQAWYRSPSITHAMRLMIQDVHKGLGTGEYVKMVRGG